MSHCVGTLTLLHRLTRIRWHSHIERNRPLGNDPFHPTDDHSRVLPVVRMLSLFNILTYLLLLLFCILFINDIQYYGLGIIYLNK